MSSPSALRRALLLLAACHMSLSWDSSNIWFPDTNNPVFYNLTFYPQAAMSVEPETTLQDERLTTEPPRYERKDVKRPPPRVTTVFNRQDDSDVLTPPRAENARPFVDTQRFNSNGSQNRQPSRAPASFQSGSENSRPSLEASRFDGSNNNNNNNQNRQPSFTNVRSRVDTETRRPIKTNRNNQNRPATRTSQVQQGVKTATPEEVRRTFSERQRYVVDQQNQEMLRNRPVYQTVGVKTAPLPDNVRFYMAPSMHNNNNDKQDHQPSRNRLRRTENGNFGNGGMVYNQMADYNGNTRISGGRIVRGFPDNSNTQNVVERQSPGQQYPQQTRSVDLRQTRQDERLETSLNNGLGTVPRPTQRAVVSADENRGSWNSGGTTGSGGEVQDLIEDNVIPDGETTSKPAGPSTGPSKCVWAIISCCKPSSPQIRYMCFETLGCHGAFWDTNPCSLEMTMAALQATANFYKVPPSDN